MTPGCLKSNPRVQQNRHSMTNYRITETQKIDFRGPKSDFRFIELTPIIQKWVTQSTLLAKIQHSLPKIVSYRPKFFCERPKWAPRGINFIDREAKMTPKSPKSTYVLNQLSEPTKVTPEPQVLETKIDSRRPKINSHRPKIKSQRTKIDSQV